MARFMRFMHKGAEKFGTIGKDAIAVVEGGFAAGFVETGETVRLDEVEAILAPVQPGKLVAIGLNYKLHAAEFNREPPEEPVAFLLSPSSVTGPDQPIRIPAVSDEIGFEAELAVVMGKHCFNVAESKAPAHIFGYTCANDVTARDVQRRDGQWCRCKSYLTFTPLGPHIVTDVDVSDLAIASRLNGTTRQSSRTSDMIFSVPRLIAFVSTFVRLEPGDVVITGTPGGVGLMRRGDAVEVEIERIGVLRNRVE